MCSLSLLKRILSSKPKDEESQVVIVAGNREFALPIDGESYHQDALEEICGPLTRESVEQEERAFLILEDNNPRDRNSVRVEIQGKGVGYLTGDVALVYREQLKKEGKPKAIGQCQALIRDGWDRVNNKSLYRVWLDMPAQHHRALILSPRREL